MFGYDAFKGLIQRAEGVADDDYHELIRKADSAFEDKLERAQQPRVKDDIVRERGYFKQSLVYEEVAEFNYTPGPCQRPYRMIALRKLISEERGQLLLDVKTRYFFYITDLKLRHEDVCEPVSGLAVEVHWHRARQRPSGAGGFCARWLEPRTTALDSPSPFVSLA